MFDIAVTTPSPEGLTSAWMDTSPLNQPSGSIGGCDTNQGFRRKDDQPMERMEQVVSFISRLMGPAALLLAIGVAVALIF